MSNHYNQRFSGERFNRGPRNLGRPDAGTALRQGIAVVVLGVITAGGLYSCQKLSQSPEEKAQVTENKLIEKIKGQELELSNDIIILNPGTKVRETPDTYAFDSETGRDNRNIENIAFKVEDGKNLVIPNSFKWLDETDDEWRGFLFDDKKVEEPQLMWINLTRLNNESKNSGGNLLPADERPVKVISDETLIGQSPPYLVIVNKDGKITAIKSPDQLELATAVTTKANQTQDVVDQELASRS